MMEALIQIESNDTFQKVSEDILISLFQPVEATCIQLEPELVEKAKAELKTIISECDFDIIKITEAFQRKGWGKERLTYFNKLLESNWSEILLAALNSHNSRYSESVINFDWMVKFVLGTSELKKMQYPLLQLILSTVNECGQNKLMYDIKKDILMKLINILENI